MLNCGMFAADAQRKSDNATIKNKLFNEFIVNVNSSFPLFLFRRLVDSKADSERRDSNHIKIYDLTVINFSREFSTSFKFYAAQAEADKLIVVVFQTL